MAASGRPENCFFSAAKEERKEKSIRKRRVQYPEKSFQAIPERSTRREFN
jgi:hypothetical protein